MKFILSLVTIIVLLPLTAHAHVIGGNGFSSGATHPLSGPDHLLAMVAVGILSTQIGKKAIWKVPAAFVAFMVIGGMLAISGMRLPIVEQGIALSVLALGIAIAVSRTVPIGWAFAAVALFAVFHGHAHGEEMPLIANPAVYAIGFIVSTALLHISGVLLGQLAFKRRATRALLRYAGAGMGALGVAFLAGAL